MRWPASLTRLRAEARFALRAAAIGVPARGRVSPGPLTIAGFFSDERGVSRAARLSADAFERAGLPVLRHDVSALLRGERPPPPLGEGGALLLHANPPEAAALLSAWPRATWAARYRIGYWVWELPDAPRAWARALPWFDEIWTPSAYSAAALRGLREDAEVHIAPHPVPARKAAPDRARFGLREDVVYALACADARSSFARKNPMGAIDAFLRAAPTPTQGLVVKLLTDGPDAPEIAALRARAQGRPDIIFITERLSDDEMARLIASVDIVLSLHRAEGFGLVLAEAMRLGKPVIATAWSGNLEFMDETAARLIPARLVPCRDPSGAYDGASHWAEPDVGAAAEALRALMNDGPARAALGARGQASIAEKLDDSYALARFSEKLRASLAPA